MKNFSFKMSSKGLTLCLICVIALSGCGKKVQNATVIIRKDSVKTDLPLDDSINFTNVDTVFGHFRGKGLDTLLFEHRDSMSWRLYSLTGRLAPLEIDCAYMLYVVYEGDLDGNGTDELGIRREQEMGNWQDYNVYTYRNGEWMYLIPSVVLYWSHFYKDLNLGQDVVKPANKKGYVQVHYSWFDDDVFLSDTIVKICPIPVNSCDSIPYITKKGHKKV